MKTKQERLEQMRLHGNKLQEIFHTSTGGIELYRKVRRLEAKAKQLAVDFCNGTIDCVEWDIATKKILDSLDKILNFRGQGIQVFVNGDARGYALKIESDYVEKHMLNIYHDWGGYGILAPLF